MSKAIKITKGVDIKLVGAAENKISPAQRSNVYAIKPDDFFGTIPKLMVKQGETVKAGTSYFSIRNVKRLISHRRLVARLLKSSVAISEKFLRLKS